MFKTSILLPTSQLFVISDQAKSNFKPWTDIVCHTYIYKYYLHHLPSQFSTYDIRYKQFYKNDLLQLLLSVSSSIHTTHGCWSGWTPRGCGWTCEERRRYLTSLEWNKLMHALFGNIRKFKRFSDIVFQNVPGLKIKKMFKSLLISCLVLVQLCSLLEKLTTSSCPDVISQDTSWLKVHRLIQHK